MAPREGLLSKPELQGGESRTLGLWLGVPLETDYLNPLYETQFADSIFWNWRDVMRDPLGSSQGIFQE